MRARCTSLPRAGLIAAAGIGTHASVVRIALDGKGEPKPIEMGAPVVNNLNSNRKQTGWLWLAIAAGRRKNFAMRRSSAMRVRRCRRRSLRRRDCGRVEPQLVTWKSGGVHDRRPPLFAAGYGSGEGAADCGRAWRAVWRVGEPLRSVCRVPSGPRLGDSAAEHSRVVELWREVWRGRTRTTWAAATTTT